MLQQPAGLTVGQAVCTLVVRKLLKWYVPFAPSTGETRFASCTGSIGAMKEYLVATEMAPAREDKLHVLRCPVPAGDSCRRVCPCQFFNRLTQLFTTNTWLQVICL